MPRFFFFTTNGGAWKSPEGAVGGMRLSRRELIGQLLLFWMTMQPISTRSKNRSNDPGILADMVKHMGRFSYKEMSRDIWSFIFCTTPLLMLSGHAAQCKIVLHMSPSCFLMIIDHPDLALYDDHRSSGFSLWRTGSAGTCRRCSYFTWCPSPGPPGRT
jgi:hypothetical protein